MKPKPVSRADVVEFIENYIRQSRDELIYLVNDFLFEWRERHLTSKTGQVFHKYSTIRATGDFKGNFDYNRGILSIFISTFLSGERFVTCLNIGNIDDGNWGFFKYFSTIEEANQFTDKIVEFWKEKIDKRFGYKLPDEQELNLILCEIGVWGSPS